MNIFNILLLLGYYKFNILNFMLFEQVEAKTWNSVFVILIFFYILNFCC